MQGKFVTRWGGLKVGEMLAGILELIAADTDALACADDLDRCRAIISGGTSADAQLRIFNKHQTEGIRIALYEVIRWIRDVTIDRVVEWNGPEAATV